MKKEQSFYFPLEKKPDFVSFDVGNYTLKTVTLDYPVPELKAQLNHDPDPISRIYAAIALAKKGGLEAIEALSISLTEDPFWGVRVEAAKQLSKINLNQAGTALIKGLEDDHPKVRRGRLLGQSANLKPLNAMKPSKQWSLKEMQVITSKQQRLKIWGQWLSVI